MLSYLRRSALLILLVCAFLPNRAFATDLAPFLQFDEFEEFLLNEVVPIKVQVCNLNVLAASSYTVKVEIYDWEDDEIVYSETITGTNLAAFSNIYHDFPSFTCVFPGEYSMRATVTFNDEINPSNDVDEIDFDVVFDPELPLEFIAKLLGPTEFKQDPNYSLTYAWSTPFKPGTKLWSQDHRSELDLTLNEFTYIGWYNPDKYARFPHETYIVTQGYGATTWSVYPITGYPMLNGEPLVSDSTADSVMVQGTPHVAVDRDTNTISNGTGGEPLRDSVCAIIVSGHGHTTNQQNGFNNDARMMDVNLRLESLGPKVSADHIVNLRDATYTDILNAIRMMNGKCKKLIFFFSGHGASQYSLGTRDSSLSYLDLFAELYGTGADAVTVILDACLSGGAVVSAPLADGYEGVDVTVLTSSSKDSSSYSETLDTGMEKKFWVGLYTWTFVQGFGNPQADANGDGVVTEVEAHLWALEQNPEFFKGTMVENMQPQMLVHESEDDLKLDETVILEEAGLEVTPKEDISPTASISVDMGYYNIGGKKYQDLTYDTTVLHLSTDRIWDIRVDGALNYKFDLKFSLGPDSLPPTEPNVSEPGVLRKDPQTNEWSAHYPSVYDDITRSIRAYGIQRFSHWAVGLIRSPEQQAVASEQTWMLEFVSYPNPFADRLSIRIDSRTRGEAAISLLDATGRLVVEPFSVVLNEGSQTLQLDGSSIGAGAYYLHVATSAGVTRSLVIRE